MRNDWNCLEFVNAPLPQVIRLWGRDTYWFLSAKSLYIILYPYATYLDLHPLWNIYFPSNRLPLAAMQNSWSYIRMRLDLLQEKADAKRKEVLHMGCLDGIYEVLNSFVQKCLHTWWWTSSWWMENASPIVGQTHAIPPASNTSLRGAEDVNIEYRI